MRIFFIRHSEPNYSFIDKNMNCQWANLAPLTEKGRNIAKELRNHPKLKNLPINTPIITSPYTRTLETATIFANGKDLIIEPLLHEWLPSKDFSIKAIDVSKANIEYKKYKKQPLNIEYNFETDEEMISRMNVFLDKYKHYDTMIVFSHSRFMSTFFGKKNFDYCEIFEFIYDIK